MKILILTIYSIVLSCAVLAVIYFVNPLVIEFPKIALAILILLMLTSFGTRTRSLIEMAALYPMIKLADGRSKLFLSCTIIFSIGLLIALVVPWFNGVSTFNVWNWLASIGFTMFVFETFYAFIGASLRVYNANNGIEY